MTPAEILSQARATGVSLWAEGDTLRYRGPREALTPELLDSLKAHKAELLAELAADDVALWWRVCIREPGGRTVKVDTPSGWTLPDWQAYAARYHGPGSAVTPIAGLPKPRAPVNPSYKHAGAGLDEALAAACEGVAGITKAQFRALLSPEDIADIGAGAIHPKTLHAYVQAFVEEIRSGRLVPAARAKP